MKLKITLLVVLLLIFISTFVVFFKKDNFSTLNLTNNIDIKKDDIKNNFNKEYNLSSSNEDNNSELEEEIKNLTKKTTYLLFGSMGDTLESSEEYYKRHKDYLNLRYNPEVKQVPKDDKNPLGLDTDSEEYKDDLVSGLAVPQIFNSVQKLDLIYNSYGDINITVSDDVIISSIVLPDVKIKEPSKSNPMNYVYVQTNYIMYYYYKKLKNEWKLYYLYGESSDEIDEYFKKVEKKEINNNMNLISSNQLNLKKVYNFEKLDSISSNKLEDLYQKNIDNIVYLTSYYNNKIVNLANGFFINNGLVVTTWNFLEKALINAQYITLKDSKLNSYDVDGIVTFNPDNNIVVLKVKNNNSKVKIGDYKNSQIEDPIMVINNKDDNKNIIQTGIIISNDNYIQTSISLENSLEGSPLFNLQGEVIGMNISNEINTSISKYINSHILKEIQTKFDNINYSNIDVISFNDLKEKYYYIKYDQEKVINSIPKNKWKIYSKIGNINQNIKLELVKASYEDGIVSLRYKNDISQYIKSRYLANDFIEQLLKDGYKKVMDNDKKIIYQNKKYQVIIMDKFDYLIIVMVKL